MRGGRTVLACLLVFGIAACSNVAPKSRETTAPSIRSLSSLSIEALRERHYNSQLQIESVLSSPSAPSAYAEERGGPIAASSSFMASYHSDQLRVYARIDIPASPMPVDGYPVVLFLHGYIGIDQAPDPDLLHHKASYYSEMLDAYTSAGYLVVTPGFRGHGTVNSIAAQGIEYLTTWDAGSYVSPLYYAIDTLNLLEGLGSLAQANWSEFSSSIVRPDLKQIHVVGHSQGGDVALTVLAVAGEGSMVETPIAAASIWAGCIGPRLTQLASYFPMQSTAEAFLDGSGQWTGRAISDEGKVNPNFIFGYPPEWIESPHPEAWTWQNETWKYPSVGAALKVKTASMYDTFRTKVEDLQGVTFEQAKDENGRDF
ncbi:MAG: alpha/beta fold hydrolase, partial [Pseudomonadota bacterium]